MAGAQGEGARGWDLVLGVRGFGFGDEGLGFGNYSFRFWASGYRNGYCKAY